MTINGTSVAVSAASAQRLVVVVPSGVTTGKIVVTTAGHSVTSQGTFIVGQSGPTLSSFTPILGGPGTSVTVTGFDVNASNNTLTIGSEFAEITAATGTQIQAVTTSNTSGKLALSNLNGSVMSVQDFYSIPAGLVASNIGCQWQHHPHDVRR